MKIARWGYIGIVLFMLMLPTLVFAQGDGIPTTIEYIVMANTANLRAGPGTNFSVVGVAQNGESLLIYDEPPKVDGWLRIYRPGEDDAYIAEFLVERAPMRWYPPSQEPLITISGRGRSISDVVDLPKGAYRIDATVQDNAFILETTVIEGDCRDQTVFNELNFDVYRLEISTLLVSMGCSLVFEASNVDGNWELEIRDLLDEDVLLESLLTIEDGTSIAGQEHALTMPTLLPEGVWTVSANVNDQAFILIAHVLTGNCDSGAVLNELDFDVEQLEISTVYRSEDGCVIFWETENVEGSWEIQFEKLR